VVWVVLLLPVLLDVVLRIWVAHLESQLLHWLGENMYVAAVLGTMLLAARWLRDDLDAGFATWTVPRPRTPSAVRTDLPSRT
jgi:hypothetical protein